MVMDLALWEAYIYPSKPVTDLHPYQPKSSKDNYAGRDLSTVHAIEVKATVSVDNHEYIIEDNAELKKSEITVDVWL